MIRLTGMASGLDTESMITDLMSAYKSKKQQKVSTTTKYSWKMDAWSSLNKKLSSFYSKSIGNLRYQSSYNVKKTTVSDNTKASVIASSTAVTGTQTLAIKQLAQAGYLTGGKLKTEDGSKVTDNTTLSDLGYKDGDTSIDLNGTKIDISGSTTLKSLVSKMKDAGVNANFDAANQRIFVSSSTMGTESDFRLSANDTNAIKALANLGLYTGVSESQASANSKYAGYVTKNADGSYSLNNDAATTAAIDALAAEKKTAYQTKANAAMESLDKNDYYKDAAADATAAGKSGDDYYSAIKDSLTDKQTSLQADLDAKNESLSALKDKQKKLAELEEKAKKIADGKTEKDSDGNEIPVAWDAGEEAEYNALKAENEASKFEDGIKTLQDEVKEAGDKVASVKSAISDLDTYTSNAAKAEDSAVDAETRAELLGKGSAAAEAANIGSNAALSAYIANSASSTAVRMNGQDAVVYLNGAEFTSNKNSFDINGLTITCMGTTGLSEEGKAKAAAGQELTADDYNTISLSTDTDVDGIYNKVKGFLKEYNDLIKELDTLFNADSASKYNVLSDEEKDALSDTEVEAWEKKIKDSLLRRDDNLSSIINVMKESMQSTFDIGGKKYSLSSFGINTLSYFNAADNEKGVFHIDGDSDDSDTSDKPDLLKAAIANDPEGVSKFFAKLSETIYDKFSTLTRSSSARSFGSFYDDKAMKKQYTTYNSSLADFETKLGKIEDKYYKQFSRMEVALTKLQSSTSSITGMFNY